MQQSPQDVLKTRLEGLRRALELTDRVLSGRQTTLQFDLECGQYADPAISHGDHITVNVGVIKDLGSSSALVNILGLNYHEVGHVRYGIDPRALSRASPQWHGRFLEAFQVLEEARIETLLAAKYERMKNYFTYPVVEFFVNDQSTWKHAFLFTHGRRYLPRKVRDTFRGIFEKDNGKETTQKFADLIDAYRTLSFRNPPGRTEGARIIYEFAMLLENSGVPELASHKNPRSKNLGSSPNEDTEGDAEEARRQAAEQDEKEAGGLDGTGSDESQDDDPEPESGEEETESGEEDSDDTSEEDGENEGGTADLADDGEDHNERPDETGNPAPEDESGEEGGPEGSGSGEDFQEDPSADGGERGDGDPDGDDESDVEPSGGDGGAGEDSDGLPEEDPSDDGSGVGSGKRGADADNPPDIDPADLGEVLEEVMSAVLDNDDVQKDIDNFRGAMEDSDALSSLLGRHPRSDPRYLSQVTPEMLQESDRLGGVLRQLWAQMEPGWEYGLSEGARIDMNRAALALEPDDYDSIYVDWNEGQQDNSGIAVVIIADESSSMGEMVGSGTGWDRPTRGSILSKNVWELIFALQEIDAVVTVLTFSNSSCTLYDRNDRVNASGYAQIRPSGGTNPTSAIVEARRILTMSEMKHRLLIAISDGQWYQSREISDSLDAMEEALKVAILIGDEEEERLEFQYSEKFHVVARTSGSVFEPMAEAVVKLTERNMQR